MSRLRYILTGAPIFMLLIWVAKVWSPDLSQKGLLMARDLEVTLEISGSGAALWQQLLLPLFAAGCVLYIMRSRTMLLRYTAILIPFMILAAFLLLSFIWSDSPGDTIRRAARQTFLFAAVAGAVVISRSNGRFVQYLQAFTIFLLVYQALFLLIPHISFDPYGNFTGSQKNKNLFGGVAGACLLMTLCIYRYYAETLYERRLALATAAGWTLLLLLSASKTPMGLVVIMLPFLLIHHKYLRVLSLSLIGLWLFIIILFPILLVGMGESPIEFYRSLLPEDALTGRTGIWYHLLHDLKKSWMFGTAYGAYWGVGAVPEALDIQWSYYRLLQTGHSGFVDLCMELGVVPTVFLLLALVGFIVMLGSKSDAMSSTLIAFALLHNCLETSFLHGMSFMWVIMLVAMFNILYTCTQRPSYSQAFRQIRRTHRPFGLSSSANPA